jgi:DNA-directed RNA polymerase alpha subunit
VFYNFIRGAAMTGKPTVRDGFPAGLSQPALRALAGAGYSRLDQLAKISEADLRKLHGMGPKAIETIRTALKKKGQSFRKSVDG